MALLANWFRRRRCTRRGRTRLRLEPLEPRVLLSGSPLISEFMAINDNFRADEDGDCSDWIELYNPGPSAVSLLDWCLTDEQGDPDPWRFPDVELAAGQHLTVFASDKDRSAAGSELHADFKLAGGGEYLALLMPDGVTAVSEFDPYPAQQADVSYGIAMEAASPLLVAAGAAAEALVPTDGALGLSWTETAFVPSGWTAGATGVGYENRSGFESLIALDVKAGMFNTNGSVYIRVPFTVSEGATISTLTLRMKYDDGFAAYLDGEPVASRNAPGEPQWNALATGHHPDAQAVVYETIDLTDHAALLAPGPHVLALQGLNVSLGSTDLLVLPELEAQTVTATPTELLFFTVPTPDAANLSDAVLGFVADTTFSPDRGFYDEPFDLAIACETPGAEIRYTLDGREPTATTGVVYTDPIPVATTTIIRAAAYKPGYIASNIDTQTYLFLADVVEQSAAGEPPTGPAYLEATFDADTEGFAYADDAFNGTSLPDRAEGNYAASGGRSGGGLRVYLPTGPPTAAASGAWSVSFSVPEAATYGVELWYRMVLGAKLESGEFGEAILEIDGTRRGPAANNSLYHRAGDGDSGAQDDSGWRRANVTFDLDAGSHTLTVGAYNNRSTAEGEWVKLFIDDLSAAINPWPTGSVNGQVLNYGMDPDIVDDATWGPQLAEALAAVPSFSLVTDIEYLLDPATGIYVNPREDGEAWEVPTSVELVCPDGTDGFQIDAGLRIRGGYSRNPANPKHAFRLFFRGEYGDTKLVYPLFGDEGANEFDKIDLRTSQNYSWSFHGDARNAMVRDVFSRDAQGEMGQPYTRSRYYHLYINGVYWGLYQTQERAEAAYGATYLEGDRDEFDTIKVEAGAYTVEATDGTLDAWQELWNQAKAGFESYGAYMKAQGRNPDGTRNPDYPVLLDVDNLIDYMLVIFYGGNRDAPISKFLSNNKPNNWYGLRNRNGEEGFVFFAHDSEHTLLVGDLYEDRTGPFPAGDTFQYSNPQWIHQQLMVNDEYRLRFADHVREHFFDDGLVTPDRAAEMFGSRVGEIEMAIIAESARWGDAKVATPRTKDTWQAVIDDTFDNYFPERTRIVLEQFRETVLRNGTLAPLYPDADAPAYTRYGGDVSAGFQFAMSAPLGTIYYTTDGSDPREPGGAVSPDALVYDGAIAIHESAQVQARALVDGEWSALTDATFLIEPTDALRVTEIMYHPEDPLPGSGYAGSDFEFVELENTGQAAIDLSGCTFSDGIGFTFPAMELAAGDYVVVVRNQAAFATRYDTQGIAIAGEFTGLLDNAGEELCLRDSFGEKIQSIHYDDGWHRATDGDGFSLVAVDPAADPAAWDTKAGWRPSGPRGGSPGTDDVGLGPDAVVVNEVLSHTDNPTGDWIELHNTTAGDLDVGGWYLSDDPAVPTKYQIAAGTVITEGGYLVFTHSDHFGNALDDGCNEGFGLSELGDAVYLTSANALGEPTGYRDQVAFGAAERDVTFGRHIKSTGADDFVALAAPTPLDANAAPLVGPVAITEIMYHPPDGGCEFIELHNPTGTDAPLYDPAYPENTWRLADGVELVFPTATVLPAGGYLLVVPIEPAVFRTTYSIPAEVAILGPYTGALDNGGEDVELHKPGDPEPDDSVPCIRVERIRYDDDAPWPDGADGEGSSLARLVATDYGNDPANWRTSAPGGTPGAANALLDSTPPTEPTGLSPTAVGTTAIHLAWLPADDPDTGVALYRVFRDGVEIGTSPTTEFDDTTVVPDVRYSYRVEAENPDGFDGTKSDPADVTIATLRTAHSPDPTHVVLTFSGPLDRASAEDTANYTFTGAATLDAALGPDHQTVVLTTDDLHWGESHTLEIGSLASLAEGQLVAPAPQSLIGGSTPGLRGTYYDNVDFTALGIVRTDATVDFGWGQGTPAPEVGDDVFSVSWTGWVRPRYTERYTLHTISDDGVRLWLDGELLIENWTNHGDTENTAVIDLEAERLYSVRMDLYDQGGAATARLRWSSQRQPQEAIPTSRLLSAALPTLFVDDVALVEGHTADTDAVFTIRLSTAPLLTSTVAYATDDDSATVADGDYGPVTGTATFEPGGPLTHTVAVPVHGDNLFEPDEALQLLLSNPRSMALGDPAALAAIGNDDIPPPGPLELDLNPDNGGRLSFTCPATTSITIVTFDTTGATPASRYAFQTGDQPDAGWLRHHDESGITVARADGQEPEWHTLEEWEGIRLCGLEPGTAYTFSGLGEIEPDVATPLADAGSVATNQPGDVDRSGTATATDYAHIRIGVLLGGQPGADLAWALDVNGDGAIDSLDLDLTRACALETPPPSPPGDAGPSALSAESLLQLLVARTRPESTATAHPHVLDRDGDGDVDRDDMFTPDHSPLSTDG